MRPNDLARIDAEIEDLRAEINKLQAECGKLFGKLQNSAWTFEESDPETSKLEFRLADTLMELANVRKRLGSKYYQRLGIR